MAVNRTLFSVDEVTIYLNENKDSCDFEADTDAKYEKC